MKDALMTDDKTGGRQLKKTVLRFLDSDDFEAAFPQLEQLPPRRAINPILGFLCADKELVRWRAVTATGAVVARLAAEDREAAREIVRRLMWSLNEESGGIGWGAPEAMAEIMARDEGLAGEYAAILASYLNPQGNYLTHALLQRGVLWGLVRLASLAPDLVKNVTPHLRRLLESQDAGVRGLGATALGLLDDTDLRGDLEPLLQDEAQVRVYDGKRVTSRTVGEMAAEALERHKSKE